MARTTELTQAAIPSFPLMPLALVPNLHDTTLQECKQELKQLLQADDFSPQEQQTLRPYVGKQYQAIEDEIQRRKAINSVRHMLADPQIKHSPRLGPRERKDEARAHSLLPMPTNPEQTSKLANSPRSRPSRKLKAKTTPRRSPSATTQLLSQSCDPDAARRFIIQTTEKKKRRAPAKKRNPPLTNEDLERQKLKDREERRKAALARLLSRRKEQEQKRAKLKNKTKVKTPRTTTDKVQGAVSPAENTPIDSDKPPEAKCAPSPVSADLLYCDTEPSESDSNVSSSEDDADTEKEPHAYSDIANTAMDSIEPPEPAQAQEKQPQVESSALPEVDKDEDESASNSVQQEATSEVKEPPENTETSVKVAPDNDMHDADKQLAFEEKETHDIVAACPQIVSEPSLPTKVEAIDAVKQGEGTEEEKSHSLELRRKETPLWLDTSDTGQRLQKELDERLERMQQESLEQKHEHEPEQHESSSQCDEEPVAVPTKRKPIDRAAICRDLGATRDAVDRVLANLAEPLPKPTPVPVAPVVKPVAATPTRGGRSISSPGTPGREKRPPSATQATAVNSGTSRVLPPKTKSLSVLAQVAPAKTAQVIVQPKIFDYSSIYPTFRAITSCYYEPLTAKTKSKVVNEDSSMRFQLKLYQIWKNIMTDFTTVFALPEMEMPTPCSGFASKTKPCSYRINSSTRPEVYDIVMEAFRKLSDKYEELPTGLGLKTTWNLLWTWSKPRVDRGTLLCWQKVNHIPGARALTRKDLLHKHLKRYQTMGSKMASTFDILPTTFVLPNEYVAFVDNFTKRSAALGELNNLWILKPVGLSRGRGISLFNDLGQVCYGESVVVQHYIPNPLLLDDYKFDLRVYVLVTSFNPLEAFIYEEGFVRLCTHRYSNNPSHLSNLFMHLTNSSIQKHNANSAEADNPIKTASRDEAGGSKTSLAYLWKRLKEKGIDVEQVKQSIHQVVLKSLVCAEDHVPYQINSFELFGYDVLLDSDLKAWLIEVNASPSMSRDSSIDEIKNALIYDTIRLIDPVTYDRDALVEILDRRLREQTKNHLRPYKNGKSPQEEENHRKQTLNEDLHRILQGQVPRQYGQMPEQMGNYTRLCPGTPSFSNLQKLKKTYIRSDQSTIATASSVIAKCFNR